MNYLIYFNWRNKSDFLRKAIILLLIFSLHFLLPKIVFAASIRGIAKARIVSNIAQISVKESDFFNKSLSEDFDSIANSSEEDFVDGFVYKIHSRPNSLTDVSYAARDWQRKFYKTKYDKLLSFDSNGNAQLFIDRKKITLEKKSDEITMMRYLTINY